VKTPAARNGGQEAGGEYDGESGAVSVMAVMARRITAGRMKSSTPLELQ